MSNKKILRAFCAIFVTLILIPTFTGCSSNPLTPSQQAKREVGTVGDYTVLYEELYTVAKECYSEGMTDEELRQKIYDELTFYYAILTLCDSLEIEYDEKELNDDVQAQIDSIVDYQFGGSVNDYRKALKEQNTTDHYMRFVTRVNLLYSRVEAALIEKGELSADEDEVIDYICNNFVKTQNFMIANNEGDDPAANLADAQAARDALIADKTSLYDLIGGRYKLPGGSVHEDTDPDAISVFGKGTMDKDYEEAVFALGVNEYSDVILVKDRELASGEIADCYFVVLRLELDREYAEENYDTLFSEYSFTIINQKLVNIRDGLEFTPNEYAASLDLKNLKDIGIGTDVTLIVTVCISVLLVAVICVAAVFIVKHQKKKKAKLLEEKARRVLAIRNGEEKNASK